MTDTIRLHVTGYRLDGTIITLWATKQDGTFCPVHGDWRPMQTFITDATFPCWIDYDPIDHIIMPVEGGDHDGTVAAPEADPHIG